MVRMPAFSKRAARRIGREAGLDALDAERVAATEMEGASEGRGGLHARQTGCHVLKYKEDLEPSVGEAEGRRKTLKDLNVKTDPEADKVTNAWVSSHGGWEKE